ncbi:MAG: protoporphyrinogen oxidase [Myxococcales bacterium]|nr:protoporphyrinogen oxidase [Myxococcales bacterium]
MRIAVIGGGIGGLTAARALVAAGIDAHVLDASERPGGVVVTTNVGGFVREHAASSFLGGPPHGALALCNELGVAVDKASPRAKRRWIFIDGKLRAVPTNPIELARSDLLTWRGKLDLVREPLRARRGLGEDESVHAFAARRFGAEAARALFAPFVTGVFAADAHAISLEAGFPRLAALDEQGGVLVGFAKQAVAGLLARARGETEPKTARGLWAPRGGLGTLASALATSLGDRVRSGVRVREIVRTVTGVAVDGERWDGAVLALPAELASAMVVDSMPEVATRLRTIYRAPVAIAYLGFPERAVRSRDGFGFLVAHGEDLRVLGVVFESVVWPDRAPSGQVLLRCIFGGGRDPEACDLSEPQLVEVARRDLSIALGITETPTHASVVKWDRGIAQYQVGHRDHVRAAVVAARAQRIALAGADYRGASINELCADASVIVDEVRSWA